MNAGTRAVTYFITVNCLTGVPLSSGVWYQPFAVITAIGSGAYLTCPGAPTYVLTGGGFQIAPSSDSPVYHAAADMSPGVANQRWAMIVGGASDGTAYAVCTKGVLAEPIVESAPATVIQVSATDFKMDDSLTCPTGEVLTGGGFDNYIFEEFGLPLGIDGTEPGTPTQWHIGFDNSYPANGAPGSPFSDEIYAQGICVAAQWNGMTPITFSNVHHLIRLPADTVVAATDGSGQVKASQTTVRVSQVQSSAITAVQTIDPFTGGVSYAVPKSCGDPAPADTAATTALKKALDGKTPAGQVAFGSPVVTIDHSSLTCSPTAGTTRTTSFTYTQAIDGSAAQSSFDPRDVSGYQNTQLQQATTALGSTYVLRDTLICPGGPKLMSATATRATVACTAYGVAEWQWTADALHTLAQMIAGKSKDAALQVLNATPGIDAGSAVIDLVQGNTLPSDANDISIILVRPQDTSPVVRAP